jgi:hypothetical protein
VAIAAELIFLIGHPLFGWGPSRPRLAVTPPALTLTPPPPPSAGEVLTRLALAAARQTNDSGAAGPIAYVERQVWQLSDQTVAGGRPDEPLYQEISTWRAANGAGRSVSVERTPGGSRTVTATLPAAGSLPDLSGGRAALARRFGLGRHGATPAAQLLTLTTLASQEPIPPAVQATLLRLLAADPGLVNSGTTEDRAGRPAVAVSLTTAAGSTTVRETLLLDPRTGALLEADRTLTGDPGSLEVGPGATLAYTLFRAAGRVARVGERATAG